MNRNVASRSGAFRARGCAVLLACVAFALVLGVAALSGGTGETSARPRTLANVRGSVDALVQDGRRIAWVVYRARCGSQVQILTLLPRHALYSPSGRSCSLRTSPWIALNTDGRVLWQGLAADGNTYFAIDVFTATLRDPRTRLVTHTYFERISSLDYPGQPEPLPMASDGETILFYARCDGSELCVGSRRQPAIYRLVERRSRRLARIDDRLTVHDSLNTSPAGLAVSGRRFAVVTNSLRCCNFTPAWSHDGTRLAWIYHGDLWTIRADGTGDRQLATGVSAPSSSPDAARRPSWSPDDAHLVFARAEAHGRRGVYRADATGGDLRRLATGTAPAWSPDGTRIAFARGKSVYSIAPDGSGVRNLTANARATVGPLSWSPDSTRIAVSRGGDLYSVRADGTGETRLTTSRGAHEPAWSPDGARIVYVDGRSIAVVNADGSGATRLTRSIEGDRSPAWSPDSTRIAFARDESAQGALWVMNADGRGLRRLLPAGYDDSPQWAPGGSVIVAGDSYAGDGNWPQHPGIRLVSPVDGRAREIAPVPHSQVEIRDVRTGRLSKRFTIDGHTHAAALASGYIALLVDHEPGVRIELYNLDGSFRTGAAVSPSVRNLSAAGGSVVFATGRLIRRLDARSGAVTTLATARRRPVGLTIAGRRVVWAENARRVARIRTVTAP